MGGSNNAQTFLNFILKLAAHLFKLDTLEKIMLLNAKQACGYLGIGRYIFETAVTKGLIPFIQPSKRRLFNSEDLDKWLRNTQFHIDYTSEVTSTTPTYPLSQKQEKEYSFENLLKERQNTKHRNTALKELRIFKRKPTAEQMANCNNLQ